MKATIETKVQLTVARGKEGMSDKAILIASYKPTWQFVWHLLRGYPIDIWSSDTLVVELALGEDSHEAVEYAKEIAACRERVGQNYGTCECALDFCEYLGEERDQ